MALAHSRDAPLGDIELTRLRRRHLKRVLEIERSVYPRPWSSALFLSELAQRSTRSYLVARYETEVVGYAGMMFAPGDAHVTNIAVAPLFHGRKIGSRLLLALVTEAIARGYESVSLEVRISNSVAQSLYAKFGFSVDGLRKGYYIETREDALVMTNHDIRSNASRRRLQAIRNDIDAIPGDNEF